VTLSHTVHDSAPNPGDHGVQCTLVPQNMQALFFKKKNDTTARPVYMNVSGTNTTSSGCNTMS
jgi:hypothetical protein